MEDSGSLVWRDASYHASMAPMSDAFRIHRLPLPVPFPVKHINIYLLESPNDLMVIDTGTRTGPAWKALKKGLRDIGKSLADVRTIVLTHAHPDHGGQARKIKNISGAKVYSHVDEVETVERDNLDFRTHPRIYSFLRKHGVPHRFVALGLAFDFARFVVREGVKVDETLQDGQVLHFEGEPIHVIHVPGHAYGHIVLHMPGRKVMFSADHLLPTITPVPLLQFPHKKPRPKALVDFVKSIDKLKGLELETIYPSHGDPFHDHLELIRRYHVLNEKRTKKIEKFLSNGPKTAFELSLDLFGKKAKPQMMLTMSEVIGHLEILEERNRLKVAERNGVLRYELKKGLE